MRQMGTWILVCGLGAVLLACGPAEEPADTPADEVSAHSSSTTPRGSSEDNGDFEAGDTRGWDSARGDESRTDFETGDASSWSDTRGKVEEPAEETVEDPAEETAGVDKPKG